MMYVDESVQEKMTSYFGERREFYLGLTSLFISSAVKEARKITRV
jgi:hypothetical protein